MVKIQYRYLLFIRRRTLADGDGVCARFGIRVLEFVTRCKRRAFGHYDSGCTVTPTYRDSRGSIAGVGEGNAESQIATFHLHGEPHCINWNRGDECVRCGIRFLFSGSGAAVAREVVVGGLFFQDCLICGAHCEIGDGGQEYFDVRVRSGYDAGS